MPWAVVIIITAVVACAQVDERSEASSHLESTMALSNEALELVKVVPSRDRIGRNA
jgi:hypothetical protein